MITKILLRNKPESIVTTSVSPMPTGARNVSFDFSTASINTTNTSSAVKNISRNRPWAMLVCGESMVFACVMSPGNMHDARPPAHIEARICTGTRQAARSQGSCPARQSPSVTFSLC